MKAAIYTRVSSDAQAEKGYSLDTQLDACKKKALNLGATDIIEFRDNGYSGQFIERPAMTRLRDALKSSNFQIVVIYDPDRMARNLSHQLIITEEIVKNGAQLHFVSEEFKNTPEGMLYYSMRGAISAYEKEKIKERTQRGRKGKLLKGKLIGDHGVYGYDWDAEKSNYKINEKEAAVIKTAFDILIKEKIGCLRIAHKLNGLGMRTRKGNPWAYTSVYRLLTAEKYTGIHQALKYRSHTVSLNKREYKIRDKSEWIPIPIPVIIDHDTWYAAQKQLKDNQTNSPRNTKQIYLLKNLLICGKCGKFMSPVWNGDYSQTRYYGCRAKRGLLKEKCDSRFIRMELIDKIVWNEFSESCSDEKKLEKKLKENTPENIINTQTLLKNLIEQENKLFKLREKYLGWFEKELISENELETKLTTIKSKLSNIENSRKTIKPVEQKKRTADNIIKTFLSVDHSSIENKSYLLHELLANVTASRIDDSYNKPKFKVNLMFK